jgi:hypothetical protein
MNVYLKVFGLIFLIAAIYFTASALVKGSVHVKGMKEPISRKNRPRDYWFALSIVTFISAILIWAFLTS